MSCKTNNNEEKEKRIKSTVVATGFPRSWKILESHEILLGAEKMFF